MICYGSCKFLREKFFIFFVISWSGCYIEIYWVFFVCGLVVVFECKINECENYYEKVVMIKISKMIYFGVINLLYFLLCLFISMF